MLSANTLRVRQPSTKHFEPSTFRLVPKVGFEPTWVAPTVFETVASAIPPLRLTGAIIQACPHGGASQEKAR